jgi:hypothetical protein
LKSKTHQKVGFLFGAPGEIRTPDQLVRSQLLYPAELRARGDASIQTISANGQSQGTNV